jgi:hypothetical protein
MKNFGSLVALFALSASSVSGLAIPESQNAIEARSPYNPYPGLSTLEVRKNKDKKAKNETAAADDQAAQVGSSKSPISSITNKSL